MAKPKSELTADQEAAAGRPHGRRGSHRRGGVTGQEVISASCPCSEASHIAAVPATSPVTASAPLTPSTSVRAGKGDGARAAAIEGATGAGAALGGGRGSASVTVVASPLRRSISLRLLTAPDRSSTICFPGSASIG